MINQIRSEWVKMRSVRSTLVMLASAIVLAIGVAALVAAKSNDRLEVSNALIGVQIATMLFAVLGVQIIGQEYRFNTIRPTFSTVSRRSRVIGAKLLVLLGAVAAAGAILIAGALAAAGLVANARDIDFVVSGVATRVIIGTFVSTLLAAAFGYGIGAIVRQPVAGIMIALIWSLVAEPIVAGLLPNVGKWMPISSATNMAALERVDHFLSPAAGAIYSATVMLALVAIGSRRIATTDA
jgi:ABC-2 type transport system permease protein